MKKYPFIVLIVLLLTVVKSFALTPEYLTRGIVAVKTSENIFISWRLLSSDADSLGFNVYRINGGSSDKINNLPVVASTNFIDTTADVSQSYKYYVVAVQDETEQTPSDTVEAWEQNYLSVPINQPAEATTPDNVSYTYSANDVSVGDLDGDGNYEIILKWDPSNSKDNSLKGYTGNVFLDAYKLDGTHLWRIDLGINIRAGAHYTQFMVYDLDQDGKAEIACKTAPGTKDGNGTNISTGPASTADHSADYRNSTGYILSGPEYLTVFNGIDGKEIITTNYTPERGSVSSWGDSYGNRVDRFLAAVAYLDGEKPSLVMCRGYYTRTVLAAWDFDGDSIKQKWVFDTNVANSDYAGQGNHQLSVADVDEDGADEIIYGSVAVDNDGTGLWNAGFGHGDAMHVADIIPEKPGLEKWGVHEEKGKPGGVLLDARTGEVIFATPITDADVGRGVSADLSPDSYGMECWGGTDGLVSGYNKTVGKKPSSTNHVIWWDGDLCRELLNDISIKKYQGGTLLSASGCHSNNSTKSNPSLQADLFGDWREEVIWPTSDNMQLRIYTTTIPTKYRITTLMHDHVYRMGIVWQNVAYNQPPHTGYYLGEGMFTPDSVRPPSTPMGLLANPNKSAIVLNWTNIYDGDLAGYKIYRSESLGSAFNKINSEHVDTNYFVDNTVTLDVLYYYYITAVDSFNNESTPSVTVQAAATLKPDWPENLKGTYADTKAFVYWDPVLTTTIAGYNVYQAVSSTTGDFNKLNSQLIEGTNYTISSLTNNNTYHFAVTAVDQANEESFYSEPVSIVPQAKVVLQAEDAIIVSGDIETEHTGFNGTGYVNFGALNSTTTFNGIYAPEQGSYYLMFRYALGKPDRSGVIIANDSTKTMTMKTTPDWTTYLYDSVAIPMKQGFKNSVIIKTTGDDLGNLDEIQIGGPVIIDSTPSNLADKQNMHVQIAPNPFSLSTNITISNLNNSALTIQIFNLIGQNVYSHNSNNMNGTYTHEWNGKASSGQNLEKGIYFIQVIKDNASINTKRVILK